MNKYDEALKKWSGDKKLSITLPQDVQKVIDYLNKKGITVVKVVKGRNYDGPDFSIYVEGDISTIVSKPTKLFEYTDNWLQGNGSNEWYQVFTPEGNNIVFKVA